MTDSILSLGGCACSSSKDFLDACDEHTCIGQEDDLASMSSGDNSWSDQMDAEHGLCATADAVKGQWTAPASPPQIWFAGYMMQGQQPFGQERLPECYSQLRPARVAQAQAAFRNVPEAPSTAARAEEPDLPEQERTTVVFRNVPREWTRVDLTDLLNREGFRGRFDFAHVPVSFQDMSNLGYALVNLVSHHDAKRLLEHFEEATSEQSLVAAWSSPTQGLQVHVDRYRNSPLMHESIAEQYKPAVFQQGRLVVFPEPTKSIRAPRRRHPKGAKVAA